MHSTCIIASSGALGDPRIGGFMMPLSSYYYFLFFLLICLVLCLLLVLTSHNAVTMMRCILWHTRDAGDD